MAAQAIQKRRDKLEGGVKPKDLTERQAMILTYILQCWMSGFIPSIREIGTECDIGSPNGVVGHLTALRTKGYIEEVGEKAGLMLSDKALELVI